MKNINKNVYWIAAVLLLLVAITVPAAAKSHSPAESRTAANNPDRLPIVPPDLDAGSQIFAEECAACHGSKGLGDGPQAKELPQAVPPLNQAETVRQIKPETWFDIISSGHMDLAMPSFSSTLTTRQIWDVVAFTFSLSTSDEVLDQGRQIYEANCTGCHGEQGRGDGARAASLSQQPPDWGDPAIMAQYAASDLEQTIKEGSIKGMPAFGGALDEDQRWAVAAYTRFLSVTSQGPRADVSLENLPALPTVDVMGPNLSTIEISGMVVHGGQQALPQDLEVSLQAFTMDGQTIIIDTVSLAEDGSFSFGNVDTSDIPVMLAALDYQELTFISDVIHTADITPGDSVKLMLTLYETSSDTSPLKIERLHVFFDFLTQETIQVIELFIISNDSNEVIVSADPEVPLLNFMLPEDALNLQFESGEMGERYLPVEGGFGDTAAIQPGSSTQILFSYDLPYLPQGLLKEYRRTITIDLPLPVTEAVVMLPVDGAKLEGNILNEAGQRTAQGVDLAVYAASDLPAEALDLTLAGKPKVDTVGTDSTTSLAIGAAAFILVLILAVYWYFRQRAADGVEEEIADDDDTTAKSVDELLDAIIALDDQYQNGELPEEAYQQRRSDLKEKLRLAKEAQQEET